MLQATSTGSEFLKPGHEKYTECYIYAGIITSYMTYMYMGQFTTNRDKCHMHVYVYK